MRSVTGRTSIRTVVTVDAQPSVGGLLRSWRERRRLSQLQLAAQAEVSTRHLSFVETGRSRPTREMVERLAAHLDVPLRERNELLLSAGYAPSYGQRDLNAPELHAVMDAFRILLDAHLPHPALVLDRWWDVVDRNSATDVLLDGCAPNCSSHRSTPSGSRCIPAVWRRASATSANGADICSARSAAGWKRPETCG